MRPFTITLTLALLPFLSFAQYDEPEDNFDSFNTYVQIIDQHNPDRTEKLLDSLWQGSPRTIDLYSQQAVLHRHAMQDPSLDTLHKISHKLRMSICHYRARSLDSSLVDDIYEKMNSSLAPKMNTECLEGLRMYIKRSKHLSKLSESEVIAQITDVSYDLLCKANQLQSLVGSELGSKLNVDVEEIEETVREATKTAKTISNLIGSFKKKK